MTGRREAGRERCRVVVIGGGISGLSAAHRLVELAREAGTRPDCVVLEPEDRAGGVIRTERMGEHLVEGGPDTLLAKKPAAVALCERLGLGEEIIGFDGRVREPLVVRRGRLMPVPDGFLLMAPTRLWPVVSSPLFSLRGKLRLACEPFVRPAAPTAGDESLAAFVSRRFGREVLERVAQPVMASLFTADADRLSVRMTMPRLLDMEREHGSITRGMRAARRARRAAPAGGRGEYVSLREGMESLVRALVARLPEGSLRMRTRALGVSRAGDGRRWAVRLEGGRLLEADTVILTCPAWAAARLVEGLDEELAGDLGSLEYASCATVSLSYRRQDLGRPLERFGFFVPRSEKLPILACSFVSEKFPGRAPPGRALLRAFVGGAEQPEVLDLDDRGLVGLVHASLVHLLALRRPPVAARVFRYPRAMPQFPVGHARRLERLGARVAAHDGLLVAGGARGVLGIADSVAVGEEAAAAAFSRSLPGPVPARALRSLGEETR